MTIMSLAITIIISFYLSELLSRIQSEKSQKQKLSNCLILLYTEISDHSFGSKPAIPVMRHSFHVQNSPRDAPTKEWDNVKYFSRDY